MNKRWLIIAGVGLFVIAIGVVFWWQWPTKQAQNATVKNDKQQVVTNSLDNPDESKPAADAYKWLGAADDPKYLEIPAIGVKSFVQQVGVDQKGQVAVPSNIHLAGWFINSVKPGQPGLSIIDGHVDGKRQNGIFIWLSRLKAGDKLTITKGNGARLDFVVKKTTEVDTDKAVNTLFSQDPEVSSQLNLITCGGEFDATTHTYPKRIIVTASLI